MSPHLRPNMLSLVSPTLVNGNLALPVAQASNFEVLLDSSFFHILHLVHHQIVIAISWAYSQNPAAAPWYNPRSPLTWTWPSAVGPVPALGPQPSSQSDPFKKV